MDLKLLKGLDALLEQRSVQDAAVQLGLTQPAVSRILGRLRAATGDEILVRNGREMVPTARALELRDEVRELVARAETVLAPVRGLDLAGLTRGFSVRCHDSILAALAPALVRTVQELAPGVTLRLAAEHPDDDRDLSRGAVDLTVGCPPVPESPSIVSRVVGVDEMVLIVAHGHALDVEAPDAAGIAGAPHVAVSHEQPVAGPAEGLRRRIVAVVPTVSAALGVAATGAAVAILPRRLRDPLPPGLRARPLPFRLTTPPAAVSWHARHTADPAHTWLRTLVGDLLADVLEEDLRAPGGTEW